jgi:hypothetical protein
VYINVNKVISAVKKDEDEDEEIDEKRIFFMKKKM